MARKLAPQVVKTSKQVAIYCRVSTDEQARDGTSLGTQEQKGRAIVGAHVADGWTLHDVYVDDGVSGTLPADERPALSALMRDIAAGKVDTVIFTKIDRMARKLQLLLEIWDSIEKAGCDIIATEQPIDTSTPFGKMYLQFLGMLAELERDSIVERTSEGHRAKAVNKQEAARADRLTPYGYKYYPPTKREGVEHDGKGWAIVEDEAVIVRRIFNEVEAGTTVNALCQKLNREGVATRRDAQWRHGTIIHMLGNSHYWGKATYGKTMSKHEVDPVTGKKIRVVYENPNTPTYIPVPAIVTEEQAKSALEAVSHNKSKSKGNTKEEYLLKHLMYCQECIEAGRGGKMTSHAIRHAGRPANTNYRCQFFDKNEGRDRNHVVQAKNVERAVWGDLVNLLQNPDAILATQQQLADAASTQAQELEKDIATMSKAIAGIESKRSALLDLAGSMDRSRLVMKDNELVVRQASS